MQLATFVDMNPIHIMKVEQLLSLKKLEMFETTKVSTSAKIYHENNLVPASTV